MKKLNVSISIIGIMLLTVPLGSAADYFAEPSKLEMPNLKPKTNSSNSDQGDTIKENKPKNENTSNQPSGKRQHKPFVITKEVDKASDENANTGIKKHGDVTLKRGTQSK